MNRKNYLTVVNSIATSLLAFSHRLGAGHRNQLMETTKQ